MWLSMSRESYTESTITECDKECFKKDSQSLVTSFSYPELLFQVNTYET